ncbi:MAG: hypothetical protein WBW48_12905 [Anaerolineae bacterium]
MSFLKKIASALSPKGAEACPERSERSRREGKVLWVYVRCGKCGEKIKTRLDLSHDLTSNYSDEGRVTDYFSRKVLIGSRGCFEPIEVELTFDPQRRMTSREIAGGQFISKEEYEGDK